MATVPPSDVVALADRPIKETIVLFDVDETLTPARQPVSNEMLATLKRLRAKCAIGFVGFLLRYYALNIFLRQPLFYVSFSIVQNLKCLKREWEG